MTPDEMLEIKEWHKEITEKLDNLKEQVTILHTFLRENGLVSKVKNNCDDIRELSNKVQKLTVKFWILIAFISASGIAGGQALIRLLGE